MTLNQIVFGLTVWTMLSIVVGLGFGVLMGHDGGDDAALPVTSKPPRR
jgi:hypothetical protein